MLTSNESKRDFLLSAKLGKPNNSFNGINIGSYNNKSGFLLFDEGSDIIQAVLDSKRRLGISRLLVYDRL